MHGNQYLITTVLKGELGFSGFVVSDWNGIDQIDGAGRLHRRPRCAPPINAGIDMVMVPNDWQNFIILLRTEVQAGRVTDGPHRRRQPADPHQEVRARPVRAPADRPHLHVHRGQRGPPRAGPAGGARVAGAAEERRQRPAAGHRQQQDLRGRQERRQHRLPVRRLDHLLAGRQRRDHAGHLDPAGHPQHASAPSTTVTFNATGAGIDSSYRAAIAVVGETPYAEGAGDRPGSAWAWTPPTSTPSHAARCRRTGDRRAGLRPAAGHRRPAAQLERAGRRLAARHRGPGRGRRAVRRRRSRPASCR